MIVSLFCQLGEGFSPTHAGLTLMPMTGGMVIAMILSFALVGSLGRHMLHVGVALVAAGTIAMALTVSGAPSVSSWELAPGLFVIGLGAGSSFGQLFDFVLAGVAMEEVGSASGVLNAVRQLAASLGVAVLGTVFFSHWGLGRPTTHLPFDGLATTAWVCLIPLAITALLVFPLPMQARQEQ